MKLTNYLRDAFIRSVMADVPRTDFTESIRTAVVTAAVAVLPPKVAALWEEPASRSFLHMESVWAVGTSVMVPIEKMADHNLGQVRRKKIEDDKKVKALAAEKIAQDQKVSALQTKLRNVVYGVTTRKALAEALPEFSKYLPAEAVPSVRYLPAVANVVPDFLAAGWPKAKRP